MGHLKTKEYKELIGKTPLSVLPYRLFIIEKKIYELTKLGMDNHSNQLKKARLKRNMIRHILLEKLKEWKKNPPSHPEITYSEVLAIEERKKLKENYEEQDD